MSLGNAILGFEDDSSFQAILFVVCTDGAEQCFSSRGQTGRNRVGSMPETAHIRECMRMIPELVYQKC